MRSLAEGSALRKRLKLGRLETHRLNIREKGAGRANRARDSIFKLGVR